LEEEDEESPVDNLQPDILEPLWLTAKTVWKTKWFGRVF
jgi:hypothetical protein